VVGGRSESILNLEEAFAEKKPRRTSEELSSGDAKEELNKDILVTVPITLLGLSGKTSGALESLLETDVCS
jgi:hypothetical protein